MRPRSTPGESSDPKSLWYLPREKGIVERQRITILAALREASLMRRWAGREELMLSFEKTTRRDDGRLRQVAGKMDEDREGVKCKQRRRKENNRPLASCGFAQAWKVTQGRVKEIWCTVG
jgi:hypothetical protein